MYTHMAAVSTMINIDCVLSLVTIAHYEYEEGNDYIDDKGVV